MSDTDENGVFKLHHGTTMSAASAIMREGWQPANALDTVERIATSHDLSLTEVADDLRKYYRFVLGEGRGTTVSFAPNQGDAEHAWGQRAPEAEWESLWAVYRIKHMSLDDPWEWNCDVAGHAWVWEQMRHEDLAVVTYTTTYAEMVELGAGGANFRRNALPPLKLLNSTSCSYPEIVYDLPFKPEKDRIAVQPVPRHVPWDVFAHLLGLSLDEFIQRAKNGEFGLPASDGIACPRMPSAPWWTSDHPLLSP